MAIVILAVGGNDAWPSRSKNPQEQINFGEVAIAPEMPEMHIQDLLDLNL